MIEIKIAKPQQYSLFKKKVKSATKEMVGCVCTKGFDLADSWTLMALHTPIKVPGKQHVVNRHSELCVKYFITII